MPQEALKRGELVDQILVALKDYGPMTRAELCLILKCNKINVASVVSRLHRDLPTLPKRIYIRDWQYDAEGGRRYPRAVYAIGHATDCPKPQSSKAENSRRYRASKRLRVNSVFDLGRVAGRIKFF